MLRGRWPYLVAGSALIALALLVSESPSHPLTPRTTADRALAWPTGSYAVPLGDRGIFGDLNARVRLQLPKWLAPGPALRVVVDKRKPALLYVAGAPVGFANSARTNWPRVLLEGALADDADRDGIPDALDLLIGAKKAVLNSATYVSRYRRLAYPGGDVPRREGVCTDVVVRALRNAGIDLQTRVHRDIKRAPAAYAWIRRPDRNIDHRRVLTLLPYFKRHFARQPPSPDGHAESVFLPGDIVLMNTMGDARPDHIGIVSDRVGASGKPLIINNWTVGHRTAEMDLLASVAVTHRFRLPRSRLPVASHQRGLSGLLARQRISLDTAHRQLLLVTAPLWTSNWASLQRYERNAGGTWRSSGDSIAVRLGRRGMGRGRGLHDRLKHGLHPGPVKREGDRRSPAGVFTLGTAFGSQPQAPFARRWPFRRATHRDRWVDDPRSPQYNTWQQAAHPRVTWRSSEKLAAYRLALVVGHNLAPIRPGAGSAIFLHPFEPNRRPTLGCTALPTASLRELLDWLDPLQKPLLVQLPGVLL